MHPDQTKDWFEVSFFPCYQQVAVNLKANFKPPRPTIMVIGAGTGRLTRERSESCSFGYLPVLRPLEVNLVHCRHSQGFWGGGG
eukprot:scaffold6082_cov62-Attheya_sp.AAC.1